MLSWGNGNWSLGRQKGLAVAGQSPERRVYTEENSGNLHRHSLESSLRVSPGCIEESSAVPGKGKTNDLQAEPFPELSQGREVFSQSAESPSAPSFSGDIEKSHVHSRVGISGMKARVDLA